MGCYVGGGRDITMGIVKRRSSKGERVFFCRKILRSEIGGLVCAPLSSM